MEKLFDIGERGALRRRFYAIWEKSKRGEPLSGEDKILAELMQQHEEYHNTWEFADVLDEHEYNTETEVNPFLHIVFDAAVVNQVRADDPKGIGEVYTALRRKGEDHLGAIHAMATVFVTEFFEISRGRKPYTSERYLRELRKLL